MLHTAMNPEHCKCKMNHKINLMYLICSHQWTSRLHHKHNRLPQTFSNTVQSPVWGTAGDTHV